MRRRAFVAGIGSFLAQPWAASAVSPVRRYRVGFLDTPRERNVNLPPSSKCFSSMAIPRAEPHLRISFGEWRNASFAELASELVSLQVDVIVTRGDVGTKLLDSLR